MGQEAGDFSTAGVGQLGGALGAGFGSGQVDLGVGSHAVEFGGVRGGETFGGRPSGVVEGGGVLGVEAVEGLGLGGPGGVQLGPLLAGDSLGAGLGVAGGGDGGLGLGTGFVEGVGQLGVEGFGLGGVLGSEGVEGVRCAPGPPAGRRWRRPPGQYGVGRSRLLTLRRAPTPRWPLLRLRPVRRPPDGRRSRPRRGPGWPWRRLLRLAPPCGWSRLGPLPVLRLPPQGRLGRRWRLRRGRLRRRWPPGGRRPVPGAGRGRATGWPRPVRGERWRVLAGLGPGALAFPPRSGALGAVCVQLDPASGGRAIPDRGGGVVGVCHSRRV